MRIKTVGRVCAAALLALVAWSSTKAACGSARGDGQAATTATRQAETTSTAMTRINHFLGPLYTGVQVKGVPNRVYHWSLFYVPGMMTQNAYCQYWYENRAENFATNPFNPPKHQDYPLFVLFKSVTVYRTRAQQAALAKDQPQWLMRRREAAGVFDSCLWRADRWPQGSETHLLKLPLLTLWHRRATPDGQRATELARLPLLGPLFATWTTRDEDGNFSYGGPLPEIFYRRQFNSHIEK